MFNHRPPRIELGTVIPSIFGLPKLYLEPNEEEYHATIWGASGCLHPDTPIFDPKDKTIKTVFERFKEGKKFHVVALDKTNKPIIAQANAPTRFWKERMYRVTFSNGQQITVTGQHRFFVGPAYATADSLANYVSQPQKFAVCPLPTISDSDLSKWLSGDPHWKQTLADFQDGCHRLSHLYGQPLQTVTDSDQASSRPQADVPLPGYGLSCADDQAHKHNDNPYNNELHPSKLDSSSQLNNKTYHGPQHQLALNTEQRYRVSPLPSYPPHQDSDPDGKDELPVVSSQASISDNHLLAYDIYSTTGTIQCQLVSIEYVGEYVYYDFHVPIYENYWACGVFNHNSGKSFYLLSIFMQHFLRGSGVGLIDPHGDLSRDIIKQLIAKGAFKNQNTYRKLVYIDWGNMMVTPFNILTVSDNDVFSPELIDYRPHSAAAKILDMAYRVWPELKTGAPSFKQYFTNAMMLLIANNLPLANLHRVLADDDFRNQCLDKITDEAVLRNWETISNMRGEQDKETLLGSSRRRAYDLIADPIARYAFASPDNVIKHREWMDTGVCFIHNLGKIPSRLTRQIIGSLLLVDIEQAAISRVSIEGYRRPSTILVDEWAMFAAQEDTISHILSETRKYGLRLYLAAQSLAQVGSDRLSGALENCKLNIAMSLGHDSATRQADTIGTFDPTLIKEEAATPTQHNVFASKFEQTQTWIDELKNLPRRVAYVKLTNRPAIKIKTPLVPHAKVSDTQLAEVLATYKAMYQQTVPEAEARIKTIALPTVNKEPAYKKLFQ